MTSEDWSAHLQTLIQPGGLSQEEFADVVDIFNEDDIQWYLERIPRLASHLAASSVKARLERKKKPDEAASRQNQGDGQLLSIPEAAVLSNVTERVAALEARQAVAMDLGSTVGESASSLGAKLKQNAVVRDTKDFGLKSLNDPLVLKVKQKWKKNMEKNKLVYTNTNGKNVILNQNLWRAWEEATSSAGRNWLEKGKPEEGPHLQQLMTCVLNCAPQAVEIEEGTVILRMAHVDLHNRKTVCDAAMPDSLLLALPENMLQKGSPRPTPQAAMASNVGALGDYKAQGGGYNGNAYVYRLLEYCAALLSKLPHTYHASVLSYITDLSKMQLFRTVRDPGGVCVMDYRSQEYDDVLGMLSSMLLADPEQMRVVPPPLLQLNGQELHIESLAGMGAQSIVYVCKAGEIPKLSVGGDARATTSGNAAPGSSNSIRPSYLAVLSPQKQPANSITIASANSIPTMRLCSKAAPASSSSLLPAVSPPRTRSRTAASTFPPQLRNAVPTVKPSSNAAPASSNSSIAPTAAAAHVKPGELYAVKLPTAPSGDHQLEKKILTIFAKQKPQDPGIIVLLGETTNGALVLWPVGAPLSVELLRKYPRYYKVLPKFLASLKAAHKVALHRDLRYNNIILYILKDGSLRLVIIDWACACKPDETAEFQGTVMYASKRVLRQLQRSNAFTYTAADDLETVVKTFFALTHWGELAKLRGLQNTQYVEMDQEWDALMADRKTWKRVLNAARACNYEQVGQQLSEMLE